MEVKLTYHGHACFTLEYQGAKDTINCQTAYQIIRAAKLKIAIPMHYRTDKTGFDEISHIDDFCKLFGDKSGILPLDMDSHVHIHK